jgi:hypothetical protein
VLHPPGPPPRLPPLSPMCARPDQLKSSAVACPYAVVVAPHVDTGGPRAPPASPTPAAPRPPPHAPSHCFPIEPAATEKKQASFATARVRTLTGVGRPSHHRSPPAATPHPEHRLHLAHPALASVSRGKDPFNGNRSSEHGRAHRRAPLRGLPLSAPSPALFSRARAPHRVTVAPRAPPFTVPCPRTPRRRPPVPPLRHAQRQSVSRAP